MTTPVAFPPKFAFETPITAMDFGPRIAAAAPGASLVSCSVSIGLYMGESGPDDLTALGSSFIQGTVVVQQIQSGSPGSIYVITYTATLSTGEVWQEQRIIQIAMFM